MSLNDWLRNDWLVEHKTSSEEIYELLGIADRDLKECQAVGLSPDWRLAIAYNAALQSATAALAHPVIERRGMDIITGLSNLSPSR